MAKDREAVYTDEDSYVDNFDDGDDNGVGELVRDIAAAGELAVASAQALESGAVVDNQDWLSVGGEVGTGAFAKRLDAVGMSTDADNDNKPVGADSLMDVEEELAGLAQSYQEACKAHVQQYLHMAEQFRSESTMARRIREWEQRLEPLLQEQEARGHFDIFEYGSSVIKNVKTSNNLDPETPITATVQPETSLLDTMKGKPRHEVCRLFLSTLQLANAGNVDLFVDPEYISSQRPDNTKRSARAATANKPVDPYSFTVDVAGGDSTKELIPANKVVLKLLKEERHRTDEDELELGGAAVRSHAVQDDVVVHPDRKSGKGRGKSGGTKGRGRGKGRGKASRDALDDFVVEDEEFDVTGALLGDSDDETAGTQRKRQNKKKEKRGTKDKFRREEDEETDTASESDTNAYEGNSDDEPQTTTSSSSSSSSSSSKRMRTRESKPARYTVAAASEDEEEEEEPREVVPQRKGKRRIVEEEEYEEEY